MECHLFSDLRIFSLSVPLCEWLTSTLFLLLLLLSTHNSNRSASLPDDVGPFNIKSDVRAPVNKDIALEIFLATIENKLIDAEIARGEPEANISRA